MANERITKTVVDKMDLPEKGQAFVWDTKIIGFGVRLTPGGKSYFVQGRVNGKTRRVTIGKHGVRPDLFGDEAGDNEPERNGQDEGADLGGAQ